MNMIRNLTKRLVQLLIGLIILYVIYSRVNFSLTSIKKVDVAGIVFASLCYMTLNLLLSFRLKVLVNGMGCSIDYSKALQSHFGGMLLSEFTPGRSGYLSTPFFIKKLGGCNLNVGMAGILVPQAVEFLIKIFGSILALLLIFHHTEKFKELVAVSAISLLFIFVISVILLLASWYNRGPSRIRLPKRLRFMANFLLRYSEHSAKTKDMFWFILVTGLLGWVITSLQWYFVGKSLALDLNFYVYLLIQPLISSLMFLPITPAGLGLMEGGAVTAFYLLGVDASTALLYSLLVRTTNIFGDIPGIYTLLKFPEILKGRERKKN
ncbi:hypothetical protein Asulf_01698 [Archaeoglobus sulfaticallidus PM70-1]|uniref:Uncharacterized protein n=1 Tax=Archaeoglobus sulfaticallidus PM70-1 TaxID=387631 RepID=N0BN04_9EURY|nr:lysylphosphatidylglycerol synthase transmembrane domain-containing protein [Archaeoglobus sulfaticallidus]AGK61670.1 hypothetical protein Asulf_01698 [Archaeoglobus sulfaticallidus PM70-1]